MKIAYAKPNFSEETLNRKSTEFAVLFNLIEETISYFDGLPYINPKFNAKLSKMKEVMRKFSNVCGVVQSEVINPFYANGSEDYIAFSNLVKTVLALPSMGKMGADKIVAINQIVYDETFEIVETEAYEQSKANLELFSRLQKFCETNKIEITITPNRLYKCVFNGKEFIGLNFFETLLAAYKYE